MTVVDETPRVMSDEDKAGFRVLIEDMDLLDSARILDIVASLGVEITVDPTTIDPIDAPKVIVETLLGLVETNATEVALASTLLMFEYGTDIDLF